MSLVAKYKELYSTRYTYFNVVYGLIITLTTSYGNAGKTRVSGLHAGRAAVVTGGHTARELVSAPQLADIGESRTHQAGNDRGNL